MDRHGSTGAALCLLGTRRLHFGYALVAATYSRTNGWITTYLNGLQIDQTSFALTMQQSGDLFIGGATVGADDGGFNGLIDDVRIYNRALSAAEVQQLFQF